MWKLAIDIIYKFEGLLDAVSSRYNNIVQNIKSQSQKAQNRIMMVLKSEIKKIVEKSLESVEKYMIIKELKQFYIDVKNWLQYNDIKEKLLSTMKSLER